MKKIIFLFIAISTVCVVWYLCGNSVPATTQEHAENQTTITPTSPATNTTSNTIPTPSNTTVSTSPNTNPVENQALPDTTTNTLPSNTAPNTALIPSNTTVSTNQSASTSPNTTSTGNTASNIAPVTINSAEVQAALKLAEASLQKGDKVNAWQQYSIASKGNLAPSIRQKIGTTLDPIVAELRTHPECTGCKIYVVESGDTLTHIAKKHKTGLGLLREVNQKTNDNIRVGEKLKVIPSSLMVEVYKSSYFLVIYLGNGLYYRSYQVGLGKENKTPLGTYSIKQKEKNPTWTSTDDTGRMERIKFGDPRHKIGTRWMGFDHDGIGIHGTVEPDSIGKSMSNGCIRMRNAEVEKLFEILEYYTVVTIKP